MHTRNNTHTTPQGRKKKKNLKRRLIMFLCLIAVLFVVAVVLLPVFVSSKKGNRMILDQINSKIEGKADFSSLTMSWLDGIKIKDITFDSDVGDINLGIRQIATKPHYASFLTGQFAFGRTVIDEPKINLDLAAKKPVPPQKSAEKKTSQQSIFLPVKQIALAVNNGQMKITDAGGKTVEVSQINSDLNLKPAGKQSTFKITMNLSNQIKESKVTATGQVTPYAGKGWSLEGSTGSLSVEFNDLDIESLGPFLALADIDIEAKGTASTNLNAEIKDGKIQKLTGFIRGSNFDVTGQALKNDRLITDNLDIEVKLARQQEMINIENLDIDIDWLKATAAGTVPTTFESLDKFLDSDTTLQADFDCQIGTVLSQFPNTFGIRKGLKITSGSLKGKVETTSKAGKRNIASQVSLSGLAGIFDGKNIALSEPAEITAQISTDDKTITLDRLDVSASFAKLNCSGTDKELKYNASADLSGLQAEMEQFFDFNDYTMAGIVTKQGTVTIDNDNFGITGSSNIKDFALTSPKTIAREANADIIFNMEYQKNENVLKIGFLNTTAGLGKINITDSVINLKKDADKQSTLNVTTEAVDLQKIQPFAVMFASLPNETQLAGLADADIFITGKDPVYELKTNNGKIRQFKVGYPGRKDFVQQQVLLTADAKVDTDKRTYDLNVELTGPEIIAKGSYQDNFDGKNRTVKGQADVQYDWAQVTTLASAFLPKDLILEGKRKDVITFSSKYPADKPDLLYANLNADINSGFEQLRYNGVNLGKTEPKINIENGFLKIEPLSTTANNGKLNFAAEADLNKKPMLLITPKPMKIIEDFEINDEIAQKYLLFFNPIFADSFNVTGKTSLHCETLILPIKEGDNNDIDIEGTFSVEQLNLQTSEKGLLGQLYSLIGRKGPGQQITVRPTKFTLKKGLVHYDDMQVDIGDNPLNFRGTIGLDKKLYQLEVTLPYTVKGTTARVDKQTEAKRITLPITGTIDKPVLDVKKFLEINAQNIILEQLEGIFKDKIIPDSNEQQQKQDKTLEEILKERLGEILKDI